MLESFTKCIDQSEKINMSSAKSKLSSLINDYNFLFISKHIQDYQFQKINQNLDISNFIIIDVYSEQDQIDGVFIIGFQNTILIIKQSTIHLLKSIFAKKKELTIYFLKKSRDIFNKYINVENHQIECDQIQHFNTDIIAFNHHIYLLKNNCTFVISIFEQIKSCITGYLIIKSYIKLNQKQKNLNISEEKQIKEISWSDDDYVILRVYGVTSKVLIVYHIELNEIFVIKGEYVGFKRECDNYLQIKYPLLPSFYGQINTESGKSLVIQYINGQTLSNIENFHFEEKNKYAIIFEILLIFNYLHKNEFVYRDLKPDNVIIDDYQNAYLIDFDRMIKISDTSEHTLDIQDSYSSPEVWEGQIDYKNDIYSIGRMIYFIINEEDPSQNPENDFIQNQKISLIYKQCTDYDVHKRPSISELILEFYVFFRYDLQKLFSYKNLNVEYFEKLVENDFNKVVKYFILSADLNDALSQNYLGFNYIKIDINKAIQYFTQAANQNETQALFNLGVIYYEGEYIEKDTNKAIQYFTQAANHMLPSAQNILGEIYHAGVYIKQDINKAIQYFTQAANQNDPQAIFNLGTIYYEGKYCEQDISKAIQYYTQAANQNHRRAQHMLGLIYLNVMQDINKAIKYFSLAANQNLAESQYNLGAIYFEGVNSIRNIDKAIHYFTLAANQNLTEALNVLGLLYYEGRYIDRDINKSIHYFSLSAKKK